MGVMALKTLLKDVQFSFQFANTHMRVGMPSWMRQHANRHRSDLDRIRQTDTDASMLAKFRDNIKTKHTSTNDSGEHDYRQMVDILIRRGGLLDHYAGPMDVRDWADARNLKGQLRDLMQGDSWGDKWNAFKDISNNKAILGAMSVSKAAYQSAVQEIMATANEEIRPEVVEAVVTTIVEDLNIVSVEVFGEPVTVDDFKRYLAEVGDGIGEPTQLTM